MIYQLAVGGLENGLVNLINRLPADRYSHTILSLEPATEFKERIKHPDTQVIDVNKRPGLDPGVYARVWKLLRQIDPDIVHTRNLPALDLLAPAFFSGRRKLVHSEHGLGSLELDGKNAKYNTLRKLSRLVTDHYIVVSRDLEKWLRDEIGIPESRVDLIYNGVDTDGFRPGTGDTLPDGFHGPDTFVIGSVGRFAAIKNYDVLTTAFCSLIEDDSSLRSVIRLVIVGDGATKAKCEEILAQADAQDLAWFPGYRDDVADLYRQLDLFVLPSAREGISNTLLEAMSSGLPVVATSVGGTPEIVPDRVVGELVPPGDPGALAAAIRRYLEDEALRKAHGKAARQNALSSHSLQGMVDRYDEIYRSL